MENSGINLTKAKEANRALLLQLICTSESITRTELSVRSQLSPMTITNIVNEFLAQKLIVETPPEDTARVPGRTPMLLQISPDSPVIVGIRMTSHCLYGIVGTLSVHPIIQKDLPLSDKETEETKQKISTLLEETYSKFYVPRDFVFMDKLPETPLMKVDFMKLTSADPEKARLERKIKD